MRTQSVCPYHRPAISVSASSMSFYTVLQSADMEQKQSAIAALADTASAAQATDVQTRE